MLLRVRPLQIWGGMTPDSCTASSPKACILILYPPHALHSAGSSPHAMGGICERAIRQSRDPTRRRLIAEPRATFDHILLPAPAISLRETRRHRVLPRCHGNSTGAAQVGYGPAEAAAARRRCACLYISVTAEAMERQGRSRSAVRHDRS